MDVSTLHVASAITTGRPRRWRTSGRLQRVRLAVVLAFFAGAALFPTVKAWAQNAAPAFTSSATASVPENTATATTVLTVTATDGDTEDSVESYALGGTDAGDFTLGTSNGELKFAAVPDFEAAADSDEDNAYVVEVTATSGTGMRELTATQTITITVTDVEPPAAPSQPSVAAASRTSLTASWTAPTNTGKPPITDYDVQYRTPKETGTWKDASHSGTTTSATITGLEMGTEYGVQVRAVSSEGAGDWSTEGTGSTTANQAPTFSATSMTRTVAENTAASTAFGAVVAASDPENDSLMYTLGGTNASAFDIVAGRGQLRTRAALDHETKNSYEVTVTADDGNGGTASATVTIAVSDVNEPPSAPAAPTVASISGSELKVTWTAPANDGKPAITNYDLQYGVRGGSTTVKSDVGTDLTESLTALTAGNLYDVRVRAKNDEGTGGWSSAGSARTAPAQVTGVNVAAEVDALRVSWTSARGATGYKVQWKSGSETFGSGRQRTTAGNTSTSDTIPSLAAAVTYTVQVIGTHADTPDGAPSSGATGAPLAGVSIAAGSTTVDEGTAVEFTLTRSSGTVSLPVTVSVTRTATFLESHTATNPSTETVTFAANAGTATLTLATHADSWDEDNGTFRATVTSGTGYRPVASTSASVTVRDNDDTPVLSLADQTVNEGDGTAQVCVSMTPPSHKTVQVRLSTTDGTAVSAADKDYTAVDTTLTIAPGNAADAPNTQACAGLAVTDDPLLEDPETLTAALGTVLNATLSTTDGTATVTIADNETAAAVDLTDATLSVAEDTDSALEVCATLAPLAGKPISVRVATANGTAQAGRDFDALASDAALDFPVETGRACLPVTVIDNTDDDGDRDFTVSLAATAGLDSRITLGATTGTVTVTIEDEDVLPGAPQSLTADPWSGEVLLSWDAADAGSDPILRYEYCHRSCGSAASWTTAALATSVMATGLTNGTSYTLQVRAVNEVGAGSSAEVDQTPQLKYARVTVEAKHGTFRPHKVLETDVAFFTFHRTGPPTGRLGFSYQVYLYASGTRVQESNEVSGFPANASKVEVDVLPFGNADRVDVEVFQFTPDEVDSYKIGDPKHASARAVSALDDLPGAPGSLAASSGGGSVTLTWTAGSRGNSDIVRHRYRQRTGGLAFGEWKDIPNSAPTETNATSYTVTGLTNAVTYFFQVQAVNGAGPGTPSDEASATPTGDDVTAPRLVNAVIDQGTLTLTYDERLDSGSTPSTNAFTVAKGTSTFTVNAVSVRAAAVTLTVAPPAAAGETLTVSYTVPTGTNAMPVQDIAGNDADGLRLQPVTNNTPAPPDPPTDLVAERGNARVILSWTPSASDGGSPVTMHQYQQKEGGSGPYGGWMNIGDSAPDGANAESFAVTGLTNETQYFFRVQAVNRVGESGESNDADATPTASDIVAPELVSAQVNGDALTLAYNEPLSATPPAAGLFTVTAGSGTPTVSRATVDGAAVTLTLAPAVTPGDVVSLTYAPTLGGPALIRDEAGNVAGSFSNRPVPNLPGAPENRAPSPGNGQVTLNWNPGSDGGSPVTGYRYRQRQDGGTYGEAWDVVPDSAPGGANERSYTVGGLVNGTEYFFEVRAANAVGAGPASNEASATPSAQDTTAPELLSAAVEGATLTLDYNEALDETSTPPADAFSVTAGESRLTVDAVVVSGAAVTLTLSEPVVSGAAVTLSYAVPTGPEATPIRDAAGNAAVALSGQQVTNDRFSAPEAPENLTARSGDGEVTLNWNPPGGDGGSAITGYQYRQREGGVEESDEDEWTSIPHSAPGGANERGHTVGGLANGTEYFFAVRAANAAGAGPASNEAGATPSARDTTAPELLSAAVEGATLTLDYNEALDETSTPPPDAFPVTAGESRHTVDAVVVSGAAVTLTLSGPVSGGVAVTLDYMPPVGADATPVRDLAGNPAAAFRGRSVTNFGSVPALPGAPGNLRARPGNGRVRLTWRPPADDGGTAVTKHQYRQKLAAGAYRGWIDIPDSASGGAYHGRYTVVNLTNDVRYSFQVRAVNATGGSPPSNEASAAPRESSVMDRINRVNRTVLSEAAGAVTAGAVDAVRSRIEAASTGSTSVPRPMSFRVAGSSTLHDILWSNRQALEEGTVDAARVLGNSSFILPLGAVGDGSRPWGGWTFWGTGDYRGLSGGSVVEWDGAVTGAHLGADVSVGENLLAGLSVSWSQGTFDYADSTDGVPMRGDYETHLASLSPYVAWKNSDGVRVWAAAGSGLGEIGIDDNDDFETGRHTSDVKQHWGALGAGGTVFSSGTAIGGGVTALTLEGSGWFTRAEVDGTDEIDALSADAGRVRLALEGSHSRKLAAGGTLTASLAISGRHDAGDGENTGTGAEVGGGVRFADAATGLTVEARGWALVVHGSEVEEWGLSGTVQLDPGASGRGLSLSLRPAWGENGRGFDRLWERARGAADEARGRLDAEMGYGVEVFGGRGVLTPHVGVTLAGDGGRRVRAGLRLAVSRWLRLSLDGERSEFAGKAPEHGITLRAVWRF